MKLKNIVWVVSLAVLLVGCNSNTPEAVTTELVQALATGDCDNAQKLTVEDAFFIVQMIIDAGCVVSDVTVKSVDCDVQDNTARCNCLEDRNGIEMNFSYDLKKIDGTWKVSSWPLDF